MTTLTEKWVRSGKSLVLKLTHDDGRLAGTIIQRPATIAGAMMRFEAQPYSGGPIRDFRNVAAAKLYIQAFAAEAEYTVRAIANGLTVREEEGEAA